MNKPRRSLLASALLSALYGCQSLGTPARLEAVSPPLAAPTPAPLRSRAPSTTGALAPVLAHTPALTLTPALALNSALAVTPPLALNPALAVTPLLTPTCAAGPAAGGFYGFYRTDAWQQGSVVLTFDDGPHPRYTPRVLDLLAEHTMKATFFVVGRAISRSTYPLVQRMVAEGHTLGSHSYSHDVTMTRVAAPEQTVSEIRGQHEVTAILIDLGLMATSGDDFDGMYRRVFAADPAAWLAASTIRKQWQSFLGRHRDLLIERGHRGGARPYAVLYSRPPGGGPYVEHDGAAGIALYDEALRKLGMMNVMWHGESGDTDPARRGEFAFLTANLDHHAKRGGVLLIHDYIRPDALALGLSRMAADTRVRIISMHEAVRTKYGCSSDSLGVKLADAARAEILGRGGLGTDLPALTARAPNDSAPAHAGVPLLGAAPPQAATSTFF